MIEIVAEAGGTKVIGMGKGGEVHAAKIKSLIATITNDTGVLCISMEYLQQAHGVASKRS